MIYATDSVHFARCTSSGTYRILPASVRFLIAFFDCSVPELYACEARRARRAMGYSKFFECHASAWPLTKSAKTVYGTRQELSQAFLEYQVCPDLVKSIFFDHLLRNF